MPKKSYCWVKSLLNQSEMYYRLDQRTCCGELKGSLVLIEIGSHFNHYGNPVALCRDVTKYQMPNLLVEKLASTGS